MKRELPPEYKTIVAPSYRLSQIERIYMKLYEDGYSIKKHNGKYGRNPQAQKCVTCSSEFVREYKSKSLVCFPCRQLKYAERRKRHQEELKKYEI